MYSIHIIEHSNFVMPFIKAYLSLINKGVTKTFYHIRKVIRKGFISENNFSISKFHLVMKFMKNENRSFMYNENINIKYE